MILDTDSTQLNDRTGIRRGMHESRFSALFQ